MAAQCSHILVVEQLLTRVFSRFLFACMFVFVARARACVHVDDAKLERYGRPAGRTGGWMDGWTDSQAERILYLPSAGFCFLLAVGLYGTVVSASVRCLFFRLRLVRSLVWWSRVSGSVPARLELAHLCATECLLSTNEYAKHRGRDQLTTNH